MVDADEGDCENDSPSIIKISFDMAKGSADNIEMEDSAAREEHFVE